MWLFPDRSLDQPCRGGEFLGKKLRDGLLMGRSVDRFKRNINREYLLIILINRY